MSKSVFTTLREANMTISVEIILEKLIFFRHSSELLACSNHGEGEISSQYATFFSMPGRWDQNRKRRSLVANTYRAQSVHPIGLRITTR